MESTADLISIGEAASILGVSTQSIRRYAEKKKLPVVILPSKHRRFRREDVEALLEQEGAA